MVFQLLSIENHFSMLRKSIPSPLNLTKPSPLKSQKKAVVFKIKSKIYFFYSESSCTILNKN